MLMVPSKCHNMEFVLKKNVFIEFVNAFIVSILIASVVSVIMNFYLLIELYSLPSS